MANAFQHSAFQVDAFQELLAANGYLYAIDQSDTGAFVGTITGGQVFHGDGDAWKKHKELQKKLIKLEQLRMKAMRDDAAKRKQAIADLIDPPKVNKRKQKELQSNQELKVDIPSIDLVALDRSIAQLEKQKQDIARALAYKEEVARIQAELVILEAHRLAELDDEEALLLLL
jgi:hypothetical protein